MICLWMAVVSAVLSFHGYSDVCKRWHKCSTMQCFLTLFWIIHATWQNFCRISRPSKSKSSIKLNFYPLFPCLFLAVDWLRPGSFTIPVIDIFSALSFNVSFSEVLCRHFWSEYVLLQQIPVMKRSLCWKPGHEGFHHSNGPLTQWMSLYFTIQTRFTEEMNCWARKLITKTKKKNPKKHRFHLAWPHCAVTLRIQYFIL